MASRTRGVCLERPDVYAATGTFRSRAFSARSHSQSSGWSNVSPAPTSSPEISNFPAASRIRGSATAGSRRAARALGNPSDPFRAQ